MLRVVAVQRDADPEREFILLQNQSALRLQLRDHVLLFSGLIGSRILHIFTDDEFIFGSAFVQLRQGVGQPHWARTRDGSAIYVVNLGERIPLSTDPSDEIKLLKPCHSFRELRQHATVRTH